MYLDEVTGFAGEGRRSMKKSGLAALTACGTVFSGTTQDVSIDANVPGVSIYADGMFICKTPCIYPFERASGSVAIMGKKEGYKDVGVVLKSKINPAAYGNLVFVYSWITDVVDGAAWRYKQDGLFLNMEKSKKTAAETEKFKKSSEIRRFVLYNFQPLQSEAVENRPGEHIKTLSALSGIGSRELTAKIGNAGSESALANEIAETRLTKSGNK